MMRRKDFVVNPADLGAEHFGKDPQLGNDIDQGADPAFQLEEFVQHHYFFLFEDTVAALKITSFIPHEVFRLIEYPFQLVQGGLCKLHVPQS